MVDVVQLVRASDCGSECRGFESHPPPRKPRKIFSYEVFYSFIFNIVLAIHLTVLPKTLQHQLHNKDIHVRLSLYQHLSITYIE